MKSDTIRTALARSSDLPLDSIPDLVRVGSSAKSQGEPVGHDVVDAVGGTRDT